MTSNLILCERITGANGADGLRRIDIQEIEPKVYRHNPAAGGMEWTTPSDFAARGWAGRAYWSLLDPVRFHVVKEA